MTEGGVHHSTGGLESVAFSPPALEAYTKPERKYTPAPSGVFSPILSLFASTEKAMSRAGSFIKNPTHPDWRRNQKYDHVLKGFKEGILGGLQQKDVGGIGKLLTHLTRKEWHLG